MYSRVSLKMMRFGKEATAAAAKIYRGSILKLETANLSPLGLRSLNSVVAVSSGRVILFRSNNKRASSESLLKGKAGFHDHVVDEMRAWTAINLSILQISM